MWLFDEMVKDEFDDLESTIGLSLVPLNAFSVLMRTMSDEDTSVDREGVWALSAIYEKLSKTVTDDLLELAKNIEKNFGEIKTRWETVPHKEASIDNPMPPRDVFRVQFRPAKHDDKKGRLLGLIQQMGGNQLDSVVRFVNGVIGNPEEAQT